MQGQQEAQAHHACICSSAHLLNLRASAVAVCCCGRVFIFHLAMAQP
jgi:hypothetical protein